MNEEGGLGAGSDSKPNNADSNKKKRIVIYRNMRSNSPNSPNRPCNRSYAMEAVGER